MSRSFTAGICAVCKVNKTVGPYTICDECMREWRTTDRSLCPACGSPKTTEKSALCFLCEAAYREAKHPAPAASSGDFRPGYCARCKRGAITRRNVDLCDSCFRYWKGLSTPVCAVCGTTQLERRANDPNSFRDLCRECYTKWSSVQRGGNPQGFIRPSDTAGMGSAFSGVSPLGAASVAPVTAAPQSSGLSYPPQTTGSTFHAVGVSPLGTASVAPVTAAPQSSGLSHPPQTTGSTFYAAGDASLGTASVAPVTAVPQSSGLSHPPQTTGGTFLAAGATGRSWDIPTTTGANPPGWSRPAGDPFQQQSSNPPNWSRPASDPFAGSGATAHDGEIARNYDPSMAPQHGTSSVVDPLHEDDEF